MNKLYESTDMVSILTNRIIRKLNWVQTLEIYKMDEPNFSMLSNICSNLNSNFYNLSEEDRKSIMTNIFNIIKTNNNLLNNIENKDGNLLNSKIDKEQLKQIVTNYINSNGNIIKSADDFINNI